MNKKREISCHIRRLGRSDEGIRATSGDILYYVKHTYVDCRETNKL